ncbi:MAG TPA: redoxin family protein [Herpetosiphonaceae bacterium]
MRVFRHGGAFVVLALLAACGAEPAASVPTAATLTASAVPTAPMMTPAPLAATGPTPSSVPPSTSASQVSPSPIPPTVPATPMSPRPAWQQLPLIDARTGAPFTLADFAGKTVYVEPMATWCSNCRQQLTVVREVQATLADPSIVFVALSVETTLPAADLAAYADAAGFPWTFAVITPELLRELTTVFGRTVTNPPATPHFIVGPDGATTALMTGIDDSATLLTALRAAGAATP